MGRNTHSANGFPTNLPSDYGPKVQTPITLLYSDCNHACFFDYVFKYDFRQTQWMVISYVVLYFAGIGGMIGIASQAGRGWTISAVILFFIAAVLAFVQRAVTGI